MGVGPHLYARLTDAQAELIYRHPRDSENRLLRPRPPAAKVMTFEEELAELDVLAAAMGADPEQLREMAEHVRRKHEGG